MVFYKRLTKVDFVKVAYSVLVSIAESQENCFLEVVCCTGLYKTMLNNLLIYLYSLAVVKSGLI